MLDHKYFDEQKEKLELDISRITAHHAERLKHLYHNPALQIFRLEHTASESNFVINGNPPNDIAAEIRAAYEHRFSYSLEQK